VGRWSCYECTAVFGECGFMFVGLGRGPAHLLKSKIPELPHAQTLGRAKLDISRFKELLEGGLILRGSITR